MLVQPGRCCIALHDLLTLTMSSAATGVLRPLLRPCSLVSLYGWLVSLDCCCCLLLVRLKGCACCCLLLLASLLQLGTVLKAAAAAAAAAQVSSRSSNKWQVGCHAMLPAKQ
jgi:hypothetical protein